MLVDGRPQRSCLTFAVSCQGDDIRTVEGFDSDPVMAELNLASLIWQVLRDRFRRLFGG